MDAAREQARGRTVKVAWGTRGPAPTEQEVLDYFSHYGTIVQVKLKATAGLVLFSEAADANAAVARASRDAPAPCAYWEISQFALSPASPDPAAPSTPSAASRAAEPEPPESPAGLAPFHEDFCAEGSALRQRARAHAKLLELKMLIAQFYLDQARYFDLKRRRMIENLAQLLAEGASENSNDANTERALKKVLKSLQPEPEQLTPPQLQSDMLLVEKLEAALEAGDFASAGADLEDGDVDEFCFCLREQLGAMSDELHRREGILRGYGDGRRY